VIKSLDLSDEIVVVKKDTLWAFVVSALKLLFMLLFKKSDIAIDLEYYSKFSAIVTYLSGAPVRIGFYLPSFWREALFTHLVYFNYFRHITETYSMVGSILGVKVSDMPCRFNTDESQRKSVEVILRQKGWVEGNKLIGINCNAGELAHCRRWPQEHFAKLINALGELSGYTVILVGSGDDMSYVNGLYNNLNSAVKKNVINAAGLFNITQFFALISMMKLFITNDSGPLHLAHLAGTPTISFWGPSPTWLYGAKDKNKHKQLFQAIACSPCMGVHRAQAGIFCNQTIPCLTNILPEDVIACAKEILGVI
jgi:ADP-heptose:LPS heptosyltransferase